MSPVLLIVRRELTEKVRSKPFWIVNAVIVILMLAAVVLPSVLGDEGGLTELTVLGVGDEAASVLAVAAQQDELYGIDLRVETGLDEAAARAAVQDETVDLALLGTDLLLGLQTPSGDRVELIDSARRLALLDAALADAGVTADERAQLLQSAPLDVAGIELGDDDLDPIALGIGLLAVGMLYALLIFYGQQVAQGIVQEKQSRVIEVLLATVRPVQLLGGKLLGLGLLGMAQIAMLGVAGGVGLLITGTEAVPPQAVPTVIAAVLWFFAGFGLYASLFALAAAVVAKMEDLQSTMMAPVIVLIGSFVLVQFTVAAPEGVTATVAALMPFSAPIAQPLMVAMGTTSLVSTLLGLTSVIATTALIVPFAARVHAGAALSVRQRISVREALRRSRA